MAFIPLNPRSSKTLDAMTNFSNGFIKANTLGAGANGAITENGAISYATFGSALMDQFGKAGAFRDRDIMDVWADQQKLWSEDPESALKFPFYLRMITFIPLNPRSSKTITTQKSIFQ